MSRICRILSLLLVCVYSVSSFATTSDKLRVTLPNGSKLIGAFFTSYTGRGIRAFIGVPYAEPPVGKWRFRAPQKVKPWKGELMVQKDKPECIQRNPFFRDYEVHGDEDCLYLNVYTPENVTSGLSVMVWFHGGGFMCGAGTKEYYGPDYLLDHDIVYVGVSYRLGPLGFLSTGQEDCYGNWGLKDQSESLRWVQENIASFGGDPNNVLIFGESAGGASVDFHMHSPLSKGLFHKGVSHSGTNLSPWGTVAHKGVAEFRAKRLGEMMKCPLKGDNYHEMIECLRRKSGEEITISFYDFFAWDFDPMVPFTAVVEPKHDGAFITEHPRSKMKPHGDNVPWMTGVTSDEGLLKTAAFFNDNFLQQSLNNNWDYALPVSLFYDHLEKNTQDEITKRITNFYFGGAYELNGSNQQNLTNLYGDNWFFIPMIDTLKTRFKNPNHASTYVYEYTHKGACSFSEPFLGSPKMYYGTAHADDLLSMFPVTKALPHFWACIPTEDDKKLRNLVLKLWVNFANTNNQTPNNEEIKWKEAKEFPLPYMRLGNENGHKSDLMEMKVDLYPERVEFWEDPEVRKATVDRN